MEGDPGGVCCSLSRGQLPSAEAKMAQGLAQTRAAAWTAGGLLGGLGRRPCEDLTQMNAVFLVHCVELMSASWQLPRPFDLEEDLPRVTVNSLVKLIRPFLLSGKSPAPRRMRVSDLNRANFLFLPLMPSSLLTCLSDDRGHGGFLVSHGIRALTHLRSPDTSASSFPGPQSWGAWGVWLRSLCLIVVGFESR